MAKKNFEYTNEELAEICIANPDFKSPQFQLYVNDFLGSNRILLLEPELISAYLFLLLAEWNERDCGLPTDVGLLVKLSRDFRSVFVEKKQQVLQFFFEYKGRYYNRRLLEERVKQINLRVQRINAIRSRYEKSTKVSTKKLRTVRNPDNDKDNDKDINEIRGNVKGDFLMVKYSQFFPSKFIDIGFEEHWDKWLGFNEERNTPITPIQAKEQLKYLAGLEKPIEQIELCIKNNWKGLDYAVDKRSTQRSKNYVSEEELRDELNQAYRKK